MSDWNLIETEERRALSKQMAGWAEKFPDVPVDVIVSPGRPGTQAALRRVPGRS